ncbi:MAG: LysR family transcriptional regulator [Paracoccus sp. (in: a-proteobacteria)]|uniref:LysR family transcriptional regulator n=1 Tax=Paracoccus sp. TaxID=267 RepID=UPI0026E00C9F|nr:LysR family transcriptional regulator [Paracoccus sp. (in: a-proteobacteria)]MDO5622722.1 LysR family transcriptional regulator [Paracoccus sp. (in: a-proteobacteria)]
MDNRAGEMQVFLRVVETGSFSGAARQMRMTPSTISKLIGRIEARLGVRLLERSTRRLSLTREGRVYYERSQALLDELDAVEQELSRGAASISGVVRVTASVGFATVAVEPLLPAFWAEYPNITVDLSISDEVVDLYLDRTDVAFRVGALTSSSLTARKLGTAPRMIVASPDYLRRAGMPQREDDLARHARLGFSFRRSSPLVGPRGGESDYGSCPLLANNGETVRRMALAGMGLARMGEFHVRADLARGALVEVLAGAIPRDHEDIHLLFPTRTHMPHRTQAFIDFMTPRLRAFVGG